MTPYSWTFRTGAGGETVAQTTGKRCPDDAFTDHEQFVRGLIGEAQERGEIDPEGDPGALSKCVFATIIWTYRWYSPRRDRDRGIARRCADFVIAGLVGKAHWNHPKGE